MNTRVNDTGILYIVATPIGHLDDMTVRAVEVLKTVDMIAAEDTRHSRYLLDHFGIDNRVVAYHEHNETDSANGLIQELLSGKSIALISDAGTPLISDPGYVIVSKAHAAGLRVVPIPGASALITALSASGLPSDRFYFEGFLPAKSGARSAVLESLKNISCTLIFYESPHRIMECLTDMQSVFGAEREAVLARELTKTYETIKKDSLSGLVTFLTTDTVQQKGEFVLLVSGKQVDKNAEITEEAKKILAILSSELPLTQAAKIAAKMTGLKKSILYDFMLSLSRSD